MPFLLVAGWQIDFQAANPMQTELLNPAVLLLTLGFAIYLAAVPFHLWIAPAISETAPLTQVAVPGFFQVMALSVVASALEQFPWLASSPVLYQWFTFAGALTAGLGAILAFGAGSFGELAGYAVLTDTGALLLMLGLGTWEGLHVAWALVLLRFVSLTVWGVGLSIIRQRAHSDQIVRAAGDGRSAQLATAV